MLCSYCGLVIVVKSDLEGVCLPCWHSLEALIEENEFSESGYESSYSLPEEESDSLESESSGEEDEKRPAIIKRPSRGDK